MYAIIETGGKQFRVSAGQSIEVERLPETVGQTVEIGDVLLLADNGELVVGKPTIEGAKVRATVVEQGRGRKIIVFKFRSGNRYHRKRGHRQNYTRLRIEEILRGDGREERPGEQAAAEKPKAAAAEERVEQVSASIDELGLPGRVVSALKGAGIESVDDLLMKDEKELLDIRGFGAKSLEQVYASLKEEGLIRG
jgi:large subunit ribosomal protein L21